LAIEIDLGKKYCEPNVEKENVMSVGRPSADKDTNTRYQDEESKAESSWLETAPPLAKSYSTVPDGDFAFSLLKIWISQFWQIEHSKLR